jgi:hypothetical protein
MDQVFSTPELLGAILRSLSMQDVLVGAMRVNRMWNTTIIDSPTLQQHLFFGSIKPSPAGKIQWTKNPLLAEKFPSWFKDIRADGSSITTTQMIYKVMESIQAHSKVTISPVSIP